MNRIPYLMGVLEARKRKSGGYPQRDAARAGRKHEIIGLRSCGGPEHQPSARALAWRLPHLLAVLPRMHGKR
jgi:hypothetical protein